MSETNIDGVKAEIQPYLQEVINRLPPHIPEDFRRRSLVAAQYIENLDTGKVKGDDKKLLRFKNQLSSTGFIGLVYINHQRRLFTDAPDPRHALPMWLYHSIQPSIGIAESESVEAWFQEWVGRKDFKVLRERNGTYYELGSGDKTVPKTRTFKCYIEGDNLTRGLKSGELQKVTDDLKTQTLEPKFMKLFEGNRLVFYYNRDVNLSDSIRGTFTAHGLNFRGPAQDVWKVQIKEDGELELESATSNDGALGEGGHTPIKYQLQRYTSAEFLDNYLQLCLWSGKAPDEPYKTSFVWLLDEKNKVKGNAEFAAKAQLMVGYPIFPAKYKRDIIDRKWTR